MARGRTTKLPNHNQRGANDLPTTTNTLAGTSPTPTPTTRSSDNHSASTTSMNMHPGLAVTPVSTLPMTFNLGLTLNTSRMTSPVRQLPSLHRTTSSSISASTSNTTTVASTTNVVATNANDSLIRNRSPSLSLAYANGVSTPSGGYSPASAPPATPVSTTTSNLLATTRPMQMQMPIHRAYYRDEAALSAMGVTMLDNRIAPKRRLSQGAYSASPAPTTAYAVASTLSSSMNGATRRMSAGSTSISATTTTGVGLTLNVSPTEDDDIMSLEAGRSGVRDATRYETWTSKQLRKKCSHLKLRGLKNVKKHVMVEALYRYYRNHSNDDHDHDHDHNHDSITNGTANANANANSNGNHDHDDFNVLDTNGAPMSGTTTTTTNASRLPQPSMQPISATAIMNMNMNTTRSLVREDGLAAYVAARYPQRAASSPPRPSSRAARSRASVNECANGVNGNTVSGLNHHTTNASTASVARMLTSAASEAVLRQTSPDYTSADLDDESKSEAFEQNEIVISSEDVIRLVDVMLSHDFVDRLKTELSRWQFWVDARETYLTLLHSRLGPSRAGDVGDVDRMALGTYARSAATWSSMQLWEMWKELTFAYTKTCFEFTAAGAEERDYIHFCEGRPDVYYLHQRLHARPDLLHLIRSEEYIEEHCTSESSDTMSTHDPSMTLSSRMNNGAMSMPMQMQVPMTIATTATGERAHKRFKRIAPAPPVEKPYVPVATSGHHPVTTTSIANAIVGSKRPIRTSAYLSGSAALHSNDPNHSNDNSPEEGSTENSETTGEDGSMEKSNTTNSSTDLSRREGLMDQRYFGLLLQNFEAIFESLHNKKVLLAALRKDNHAPDHLIADLHDDIHVLSALKKEFRTKLRQTLDA